MSSKSERIPKRIVQALSPLLSSFLKGVKIDRFDPWVIVDLIQNVNVTYNTYSYKVFSDLTNALSAESSYRPKSKVFIKKWESFTTYVAATMAELDSRIPKEVDNTLAELDSGIPKAIIDNLYILHKSFLKGVEIDPFDPWKVVDLIQNVDVTYNTYSYKVFSDLTNALSAESSYRPDSEEFIKKWESFTTYVDETMFGLESDMVYEEKYEDWRIKFLKEDEEMNGPILEEESDDMFSDDERDSTPSSADPSSIVITKASKLPPLIIVHPHH